MASVVDTSAGPGGESQTAKRERKGAPWKSARATVFWVGETETEDNDHIANLMSAWDAKWLEHFGGVDHPNNRCGYQPCGFKPKENPFYVALPYDDMQDNGRRKEVNDFIPWDAPGAITISTEKSMGGRPREWHHLLRAMAGRGSVRERRCPLCLRSRDHTEEHQRRQRRHRPVSSR